VLTVGGSRKDNTAWFIGLRSTDAETNKIIGKN
jgi:hypothetical protein